MRVLGIDPGTAACGYGLVDEAGGKLRLVESGCWKTAAQEPIEGRLRSLFTCVRELIETYEPDAMAVEESVVGRDARIALSVGQARGAILVAAATVDVTCLEYSPTRVKQAVCGYGRAEKGQIQRMVRMILSLDAAPSTHEADALAVAICHALASPLARMAR